VSRLGLPDARLTMFLSVAGFCFRSAHQMAVDERNRDYARLETELNLCPSDMDVMAERVSDRFDRVFWFGDFNYRINGTRAMVDTLLKGNMHEVKWWFGGHLAPCTLVPLSRCSSLSGSVL
jgi:hypothetical protein